jgi:hypothetical protein
MGGKLLLKDLDRCTDWFWVNHALQVIDGFRRRRTQSLNKEELNGHASKSPSMAGIVGCPPILFLNLY